MEKTVVPLGDQHIDALTEQINNLTAIVAFLQEHRRMLLEEAGQVVTIVEAGQQELLGRADHLSTQLTYVSSLLEQLVGRQSTTEAQVAKIEARTQRLTPAHARNVQGLVEKIVRESERRSPKGTALIHAQVYGRLKTHFRAGSSMRSPTNVTQKLKHSWVICSVRSQAGSTQCRAIYFSVRHATRGHEVAAS